ncbi:MAG: RDD family protein [Acidobacteria bacterium]|nr:RDD family protein [Acidobacteriota bacterium]
MKLTRLVLLLFLAMGAPHAARAQAAAPAAPAAAEVPSAERPAARAAQPPQTPRGRGTTVEVPETPGQSTTDFGEVRISRTAVRVGSSYELDSGANVEDVAVVMGSATINGHVHGDLAVVLGDLQLGPTAIVDGDVAVVGGSATAAEGAAIRNELVIVGGTLTAPPGFRPEGEQVIVGTPYVGSALRSFTPWITRGLLWGRVIVPSLGWIWWIVGLSALIYVAIAVLFPGAVASVVRTIVSRPLSAFFAGLLTLLLVGPISTILAISVVGIVVIPFLFFAVLIGGLVGKVSVFSWIGRTVMPGSPASPASEEESTGRGLGAMLIGLVVIIVLYMVPIVGLMTWAVVGLLGLGAAVLTMIRAMRNERAARAAKTPPPVPPRSSPGEPLGGPEGPITGGQSPVPGAAMSFASAEGMAAAADEASGFPAGAGALPPPPAAAAVVGNLTAYPRASFLDRLAAGVVDAVVVAVVINLLDFHRGPFDNFFVVLLIYNIAFWAWKGTTIGGIVTSLRVVRVDGGPLQPVDAIVRGLSSLLSLAALGIGFFWILLDSNRERQAWHDIIAGTLVVRVPRDLPLS